MNNKPVGGRGKKVPYNTVVMRVPAILADEFKNHIEEFYDIYSNGLWEGEMSSANYAKHFGYCQLQKYTALEVAKKILTSKKSAKLSLQKLLQVLYKDDSLTIE